MKNRKRLYSLSSRVLVVCLVNVFNLGILQGKVIETDRGANPNRNFKVTHISQAGQITEIPAFEQGLGLTVRPYVRGDRIKESQGTPFENTETAGLDVLTRPEDDLAPRTNLLAARGYQNIWQESNLGFMVTAGDPLGRNGSYQVGADFDPSLGFAPWQGIYKVRFDLVRVASGDADIQLARARMDFFITPNFQLLNYVQYDNQTESLGLNCRLRWTYRSLLDVFVVYNRNWLDMNRMWVSDLNQFLIKIQYSWWH